LWHLDAYDLTFDEAATFYVAYRPLPDILSYLRDAVREHPPLYYVLVHLWMRVAGSSEYSLRFFAAGASIVGIGLTARLARNLACATRVRHVVELFMARFLPALALALFPFEVYYARDARHYTLMIVWAVLSALLFLRLDATMLASDTPPETRPARQWPRPAALLGLVLVNGMAVFTHYYLALLVVAQFVVLLLLRRWRAWIAWSAVHGLIGLGGVIWLIQAPGLASSVIDVLGRFSLTWPGGARLRRLLADLLFSRVEGVPWLLVYGVALLVVLGLLAVWRRSRATGAWLTTFMLLPVLLAFMLPEPVSARYLIFMLPFAALALGYLPLLLSRPARAGDPQWSASVPLGLGLALLLVGVLGVYGVPRTIRWVKSTYGQTIATVTAQARPGDGVLFYGPWQAIPFHYYGPQDFPPIRTLPQEAPPHLKPQEADPVLEELMREHQRLWVIPAAVDDVDPAHYVARWLNTRAHPVWKTPDLSLYLPPLDAGSPAQPLGVTFGDRLRLESLSSDALKGPVPAGESLRVTLTWTVLQNAPGDVELVLSLVDEQNHTWRQWENRLGQGFHDLDNAATGDTFTQRLGAIVPPGLPPGPLTLRMTVVDAHSGVPLPPTDASGPRPHTAIDLLALQVVEPITLPVLDDVAGFEGPFTFEPQEETDTQLVLAGYDLGGLRFQQGYPLPVQLHWLAPTEPVADLTLRLQLAHRPLWKLWGAATPVATQTLPLAPGYPSSDWPSGRLVSLPTALPIPADAPTGRAELTLAVLGPDGQLWRVAGNPRLKLGAVTVEARPVLRELPDGLTPVQTDFSPPEGDASAAQLSLRGYRLAGAAEPGGRLQVTYAWYTLRPPDRIYAAFNHLLTGQGQGVTQTDGWLQGGVGLTNQWQPGEYVLVEYTLEIPADAPPGPYLLAVGVYDAANGDRAGAYQDGQPLPNDQWLLTVEEIAGGPQE
jgi:hypothetical protein